MPEPTQQTKSGNGTGKTLATEPELKLSATRTNDRQSKPLGRGYGNTLSTIRVPGANRNANKGRVGKTDEPGRHDKEPSEQSTKVNSEMLNKNIK